MKIKCSGNRVGLIYYYSSALMSLKRLPGAALVSWQQMNRCSYWCYKRFRVICCWGKSQSSKILEYQL